VQPAAGLLLLSALKPAAHPGWWKQQEQQQLPLQQQQQQLNMNTHGDAVCCWKAHPAEVAVTNRDMS
jgi:hypothetical protein